MVEFLHLLEVHISAWLSLLLLADIYKNGVPDLDKIPKKLLSIFVIACVGAMISAHGHSHYLNYIKGL